MGWCKKMLEEAEEKNLALERKVEALEELISQRCSRSCNFSSN